MIMNQIINKRNHVEQNNGIFFSFCAAYYQKSHSLILGRAPGVGDHSFRSEMAIINVKYIATHLGSYLFFSCGMIPHVLVLMSVVSIYSAETSQDREERSFSNFLTDRVY